MSIQAQNYFSTELAQTSLTHTGSGICFDSGVLEQNKLHTREQADNLEELSSLAASLEPLPRRETAAVLRSSKSTCFKR